MTDWMTFGAATALGTLLLLYFTRRSQRTLERVRIVDDPTDLREYGPEGSDPEAVSKDHAVGDDIEDVHGDDIEDVHGDGFRATHAADVDATHADDATYTDDGDLPLPGSRTEPTLTTDLLLANVAASQGLALVGLATVMWWTGVPAVAVGLAADPAGVVLGWGVAAGVLLYVGNEIAAGLGTRVGATAPERLREAMAPADARGWVLLLGVVLPIIAVFEELLFRGALIGAMAFGFGIDPWLLAVGSSVAFGLGHGAQGQIGIVVTGVLGFALAAVFVVTGSLLVVVVAHYVVNALEFVVHEGFDRDPAAAIG